MDIITKNKLLFSCVLALATLNIILIGIFFWKGFKEQNNSDIRINRDKPEISSVLEKELDLTPEQVEKIKKLRSEFFEKEKVISDNIKLERDSMNSNMFNKNSDEQSIKSFARSIAENEYKMEMLRFEQALQFKTICTPEQLKKFEGLVKEIRDYFRPENKQRIKDDKKPGNNDRNSEDEGNRPPRPEDKYEDDKRTPSHDDQDYRPPHHENEVKRPQRNGDRPQERDDRPPRPEDQPHIGNKQFYNYLEE